MPGRARYSRWDGTQAGFELDPDAVLGEMGDDLLYHGDVVAALRRILQSGFADPDGRRVAGLRELLERVRQRRRQELERHDLGGVHREISRQLRQVVAQERAALDSMEAAGDVAGAERRKDQLDLLPPDLAGQVRQLSDYPFASPDAARRFEELVDRLRGQLAGAWFNRMADALAEPDPAQLARLTRMLASLNAMLEARERGQEPDFEAFMSEFGDFFPSSPRTLDELLEQVAAQLAAASALMASLTPEQRAELSALAQQLLGDLDLAWQVDQLAGRLRAAFPQLGWDRGYPFGGQEPLGLPAAAGVLDRLGDLERLESLLQSAASPDALAEVDVDGARELLGDDAARSLERLAELARALAEAGLIDHREGRLHLTPRALRRLGQRALADVFARLSGDRLGRHALEQPGVGPDRTAETKPYEWGDPFHLHIERTVGNAVRRNGRGVPVGLAADDFEVERTEAVTRASTVLLLDLSLSMPMRDNFLAAKKVAMALHALISTRYPTDHLDVVVFSELARVLRPEQLPEVSWDFVFGTNMAHALMLARRLLAGRAGTRQVLMITDGEPTAHLLDDGEVFFHYPPMPETVRATLAEVLRCTRAGIRINTFMLDATRDLQAFVERLTAINRGRAFFTTPATLGDYVLLDFVAQRRSVRSRRSG